MIPSLLDLMFGCPHAQYSFPRVAPKGYRVRAARCTGTYVACLDCGREFPYSWDEMRVVDEDWKQTRALEVRA